VCRGMPPCPWDVCAGGPGGELVGFLWGTPEISGGSRNWSCTDLGLRLPGTGSRLSPVWLAAVDLPGLSSSLIRQESVIPGTRAGRRLWAGRSADRPDQLNQSVHAFRGTASCRSLHDGLTAAG
jgi:hypothetical protein